MPPLARRVFVLGSCAGLLLAGGTTPVSGGSSAAPDPARPGERKPRLSRSAGVLERKRAAPGARGGLAARTAAQPVEELQFDAISGTIPPADPTGAAGPSHVLTAVNVEYELWEQDGTPTSVAGSLASLFPNAPASAFTFDPKVIYDHYDDRYVLVFLGGTGTGFTSGSDPDTSRIFIVSMPAATPHKPSTWCRRSINGDQVKRHGKVWADYPGLGFDADRLYVSTNQFTFQDSFRYAQILALRKDRLYDCDKSVVIKRFARGKTRDPQGEKGFTIQPAVTQTESGRTPPEFLLSFQDTSCGGGCGNRLVVWRIRQAGGKLELTSRSVRVGRQEIAPYGNQRGGPPVCQFNLDLCWDTGDLRIVNAFYDADRKLLLGGHAVARDMGRDGTIESAIRWYAVDPAPFGKTHVDRKGLIGTTGRDGGWPMLATDDGGSIFVTYSRAGSGGVGEYLSAYAATIAPGTTSAEVSLLHAGEATYDRLSGPERWGDFNGINRDPLDPSDVWMVNQYAAGLPPVTNRWQQIVARVSDV